MRKILFIISLGFITYGIYKKEYLAVMRKAATICLECIGIG